MKGVFLMELEQLVALVAFDQYKTLSNAAKALHVSQPVLTRLMKKLEEDLDIPLFERSKNRISFNETGLQAVDHAKRILDDIDHMKTQLKEFDRKLHTFSIGSCAPAPKGYLSDKASRFYTEKTISHEIKDENVLIQGLKDKTYTVIIMPYDIEDEEIESIPFMDEHLYFSLPLDHPLAHNKTITLKEMDGDKMLLMSNIGFWNKLLQKKMSHTRFLVQQDRNTFFDLVELSSLPSFVSDYTMKEDIKPDNRIYIPIEDKEAKATFYCWYLKEQEKELQPFLYHLN